MVLLLRNEKRKALFEDDVYDNDERNTALEKGPADKKRDDGLLARFVVFLIQDQIVAKNVADAVESLNAPTGLA